MLSWTNPFPPRLRGKALAGGRERMAMSQLLSPLCTMRECDFERTVVHAHTPGYDIVLSNNPIAVDTGAYLSGRLSAVRIAASQPPVLLVTDRVTA